ncbi:membrane protein [Mycoplasma feriruminatoris]|uniref:Membrane protein n=1 Tax=Mycoplasma feriruminatoris TaxID=1179777 RepID=A0ABY8HUQ7_9MOLU|nr:TIGR04554 family membrane protein [Mycoplasma feriruminatoris]WFQ90830.1 membrane protein [Mycoplasma feriruminatoris]WFQ93349.1 membrane protein [Mycoplasma feriruminatoris]
MFHILSEKSEELGKDIVPVSVIGLVITLAAIIFVSWLVFKNKDKLIANKNNLIIVVIGYVVLFIALILASVALAKYNSYGLANALEDLDAALSGKSNTPAKLKGLAYSGLVFSLIGAGLSGFIFTKAKK